jgi:hypothetical protein
MNVLDEGFNSRNFCDVLVYEEGFGENLQNSTFYFAQQLGSWGKPK